MDKIPTLKNLVSILTLLVFIWLKNCSIRYLSLDEGYCLYLNVWAVVGIIIITAYLLQVDTNLISLFDGVNQSATDNQGATYLVYKLIPLIRA